jgi:hypothetical protein
LTTANLGPTTRRIHGHIADHGPVSTREICDALALPESSVSATIGRLARGGHLHRPGRGTRSGGYTITDRPLPDPPPPGREHVQTVEEILADATRRGVGVEVVRHRGHRRVRALRQPFPAGTSAWLDTPGDLDALIADQQAAERMARRQRKISRDRRAADRDREGA